MRALCRIFLSLLLLFCRVYDGGSKFVSPTRHTDLSSTIIIVEDAKGKGHSGCRSFHFSTSLLKSVSECVLKVICIISILREKQRCLGRALAIFPEIISHGVRVVHGTQHDSNIIYSKTAADVPQKHSNVKLFDL